MKSDDQLVRIRQLEKENDQLQRSVKELSILNEIATAIGSTTTLDRIIDLIIEKCVKHCNVEQAAVMLLDDEEEERPFKTMVRKADRSVNMLPFRLDEQLTGWTLKHKKPLLVNNFETDERFKYLSGRELPVASLLSIPLMLKGRLIGLITVFNKKHGQHFDSNDQRLLSIISAQSAQVIENARLHDQEQTLLKMEHEYRLASEIQNKLLPKCSPDCPGYEVAGISHPAQVVGGDYFDFIPMDANTMAVCLGDISGKGLPAAMLMSNLQAAIRAQTSLNPSPDACLEKSNRLLYQNTDHSKFATLFYGILDIKNHQMCFSNAGHNRPLFFHQAQEPVCLETAGIALSLIEETSYKQDQIRFEPGDLLLIYSDGITEAINTEYEEFGEERLTALIGANRSDPADELMKKIILAVESHAGSQPQADDMTIVVIRRKPS